MKIRSVVPENGCLIFCGGRKKQKKQKKNKKNICTHIRIRLIGGCIKHKMKPVLAADTAARWSRHNEDKGLKDQNTAW